MAIKKYNPTSNGRRNMTGYDFSEITKSTPVSPWGKPALGYKTRSKKARSNKLIVRGRKK